MKKSLIYFILAMVTFQVSKAQELTNKRNETVKTETQKPLATAFIKPDKLSVGIGFGLDNGGIGASLHYYFQKNIGIFVGVGDALINVGYNAGIKFRIISDEVKPSINPYFIGMYGYNTVIKVKNLPAYNKMFYGPSVGFGLDIRPNYKNNYFSIAILLPIRGSEVSDYINNLESMETEFKYGLLPIAVSLSYRIKLRN